MPAFAGLLAGCATGMPVGHTSPSLSRGAKHSVSQEHNSEDEDEDKYADDVDMPGQNFDSKRRITVRNLRIREDIAKVRWMPGVCVELCV